MRTRNFQALLPRLREVWRLSLPAILTQITTIAMQYIDSAMVGRLGANASAAIGLVASSTWLFNGVCYALSAGFSVQVAHRIGAGNARGARSVEKNGLLAGLLVSGLLCLLGSLIHAQLPVWLKGDAEITSDAGRYFLSFSWMLPFTQLCSLTSSFLQCAGDMLTPSILNAVMCVLDVAFNALLIPRLGVFGAGLGTMLACAVVAVVMGILCDVQQLAARVLRIELLAEPLFGVSIVAAGALRGAGDTLVPSLLNLGSIWLVRVGSALVLVPRFGLTGMWCAMAVELCIRGLLLLVRQRTSKYYCVSTDAKRP